MSPFSKKDDGSSAILKHNLVRSRRFSECHPISEMSPDFGEVVLSHVVPNPEGFPCLPSTKECGSSSFHQQHSPKKNYFRIPAQREGGPCCVQPSRLRHQPDFDCPPWESNSAEGYRSPTMGSTQNLGKIPHCRLGGSVFS